MALGRVSPCVSAAESGHSSADGIDGHGDMGASGERGCMGEEGGVSDIARMERWLVVVITSAAKDRGDEITGTAAGRKQNFAQ